MDTPRQIAKKLAAQARQTEDMTPKSQASRLKMPPDVIAMVDECDSAHKEILDVFIEEARFDLEKTPDITGLIYGWYLAEDNSTDPGTLLGVMGEAILRLARMPDYEPDDPFDKIVRNQDV